MKTQRIKPATLAAAARGKSKRVGQVMIWVALLLPLIIIFVGFTADLGIIYMAQAELQATADAAALAAAQELPGRDPDLNQAFDEQVAIDMAVYYAEQNLDPAVYGKVLQEGDVEIGTWDKAARTFASGTLPYNAVRVTTRRDASTGENKADNAVRLYFLRILEIFGSDKESVDLTAQAVAISGPKVAGEASGGIIGIEWAELGGDGIVDGYDPSLPYGPGNQHLESGVYSNGWTKNYGTSMLYGDVLSGPGMPADVYGSATVTGSAQARESLMEFEPVEAPMDISGGSNDNTQITAAGYNHGNKTLRNGPQDNDLMTAGDYFFNEVDIKGKLTIEGPARIRVDGDMTVNSQAEITVEPATGDVMIYIGGRGTFNGRGITNTTKDIYTLHIYGTGSEDIKWNGDSDFHGLIYAPDSDLTINGSGDFYGSAVGKTASLSGTGSVHTDATRGFPEGNKPRVRLVF